MLKMMWNQEYYNCLVETPEKKGGFRKGKTYIVPKSSLFIIPLFAHDLFFVIVIIQLLKCRSGDSPIKDTSVRAMHISGFFTHPASTAASIA